MFTPSPVETSVYQRLCVHGRGVRVRLAFEIALDKPAAPMHHKRGFMRRLIYIAIAHVLLTGCGGEADAGFGDETSGGRGGAGAAGRGGAGTSNSGGTVAQAGSAGSHGGQGASSGTGGSAGMRQVGGRAGTGGGSSAGLGGATAGSGAAGGTPAGSGGVAGSTSGSGGGGGGPDPRCPPKVPSSVSAQDPAGIVLACLPGTTCRYDRATGCLCATTSGLCTPLDPACPATTADAAAPERPVPLPIECTCTAAIAWSCL
jgi:hypothetical protein